MNGYLDTRPKNTSMYYFFIISFIFLFGCELSNCRPIATSFNWQKINSRDYGTPSSRYPLYYAKVPSDWIRHDPSQTESISDTTKPLTEYIIESGSEKIRITVYNFPKQRIPPQAQIDRWKNQFDSLEPTQTFVKNVAHNGFVGLFLDVEGIMKAEKTKIFAWAMKLAPEYSQYINPKEQKSADYTIKAIGPKALMEKHRDTILTFAQNFGLIEELPAHP